MNDELRDSLFGNLLNDEDEQLADIIKDILIERIEKKAFELYRDELEEKIKGSKQ